MNYITYLINNALEAYDITVTRSLIATCNLRKWVAGKLYRDYTFHYQGYSIHMQWVEVNGQVERIAKFDIVDEAQYA